MTTRTFNSLQKKQFSLFGSWLPKCLLLLALILLSLTPASATVHTLGTGSGHLTVTSMSSLSLVSGDTISITTGTYGAGTFINLNNITVIPATGGVTFTGSVNIGNDSSVSFDGTVLPGVTYGYTFSTKNAGSGAFYPYSTAYNTPSVGDTINCSIKGVQLLNTGGPVLNGVGTNNPYLYYTGTPATCLYYNMTLDTILETGASTVYNGVYMANTSFVAVNIGMTAKNVVCVNDGTGNCQKIQGNSLYNLVADNWTIVGPTLTNTGDDGDFYVDGNCILRNIYRNGGWGWFARIRNVSLGTPSTSYVYNVVDVNNVAYGSIDTLVNYLGGDIYPNAPIPTVGNNIVIANFTSGNHQNETGYTTDLCIDYGNSDDQTPPTIYTTSLINCMAFNNPGSPGTSLYTPEVATTLISLIKTDNIDIVGALPAGYLTDTEKFYPASGSSLVAGGTSESFDPTDLYGASRGSSYDIGAVQHDTTAPTVAITSPTSSGSYSTTAGTLNVGGTAADNDYVSSVTWANNLGGSGTATSSTTWSGIGVPVSSTTWSVSSLALYTGSNVITVTAHDAYGNTSAAVLTVTQGTAPTISGTAPGGAVGTAYHFTYTTAGSPSPTCSVTAGSLPAGLSLSSAGVISGTPTAAATYTGTITAANGFSPNATDNFSIVVASSSTVAAINCGYSSTYTATDGTVYSADTYFTSGTSFTATTTITTGTDPTLYTYYRYGEPTPAIYNIPLSNGSYTVHIKYAEMDPTKGIGSRVFGVTVQGTTVASSFDILTHVAALTPLDEAYSATVTNGTLTVGQVYIYGNPEFSALKVTSP